MDSLYDLDDYFRRYIRTETKHHYNQMGIKQNDVSLDRNVLIRDTTLSNRLKNIFFKYRVITVGNLEDLRGSTLIHFKGMGEKLHEEHSRFVYVNKLGLHRD